MNPLLINRSPIWLGPLAVIAGVAVGYLVWGIDGRADPTVSRFEDDDHDDHVDISIEAADTLGLQLRPVVTRAYQPRRHIPAMVIEKPGQSGLTVTSPTQGIVRRIERFPGQSLSPGDLLFTIQVADEALEAAQLALLNTLTRITVNEREMERLEPLAEAGAIIGRRKLEVEYELKQLNAERAARLQELMLRGLSAEQIERVVQQRELVHQVDVRLEVGDTSGAAAVSDEPIYTVEQLDAFPGRAVRKGEELCHIANHHQLFLRGEAFETDVATVRDVVRDGSRVTAELGQADALVRLDELTISHVDNHVDPDSQTYPFYIALANKVVTQRRDEAGRLFRSWQFKPGQRAHIYIPLEELPGQIVVPRDAVFRSGLDAWVFRLEHPRWLRQYPLDEALRRDAAVETLRELELEPVRVQVLAQDRHDCVLAAAGQLRPGDVVAMNHAYQLYLAWRLQLSGGGGHDHDHDH